eukprot:139631-Rhodomonas_salina.1
MGMRGPWSTRSCTRVCMGRPRQVCRACACAQRAMVCTDVVRRSVWIQRGWSALTEGRWRFRFEKGDVCHRHRVEGLAGKARVGEEAVEIGAALLLSAEGSTLPYCPTPSLRHVRY